MSKFVIGQRVVIARPTGDVMLKDRKATVMSEIDKFKTEKGLFITGYYIEIDGFPGKPFVAEASELDPVLVPVFVNVQRVRQKAAA